MRFGDVFGVELSSDPGEGLGPQPHVPSNDLTMETRENLSVVPSVPNNPISCVGAIESNVSQRRPRHHV
jgi:hypothetical protein